MKRRVKSYAHIQSICRNSRGDWQYQEDDIVFSPLMETYCGKVFTFTLAYDQDGDVFYITEDKGGWAWREWMLETEAEIVKNIMQHYENIP